METYDDRSGRTLDHGLQGAVTLYPDSLFRAPDYSPRQQLPRQPNFGALYETLSDRYIGLRLDPDDKRTVYCPPVRDTGSEGLGGLPFVYAREGEHDVGVQSIVSDLTNLGHGYDISAPQPYNYWEYTKQHANFFTSPYEETDEIRFKAGGILTTGYVTSTARSSGDLAYRTTGQKPTLSVMGKATVLSYNSEFTKANQPVYLDAPLPEELEKLRRDMHRDVSRLLGTEATKLPFVPWVPVTRMQFERRHGREGVVHKRVWEHMFIGRNLEDADAYQGMSVVLGCGPMS